MKNSKGVSCVERALTIVVTPQLAKMDTGILPFIFCLIHNSYLYPLIPIFFGFGLHIKKKLFIFIDVIHTRHYYNIESNKIIRLACLEQNRVYFTSIPVSPLYTCKVFFVA